MRAGERLKIAVLGCAHYSHAASYARVVQRMEDCRLLGVTDPSRNLAAAFAAWLGIGAYEPEALLAMQPDAVIVAGTTHAHRQHIELAASAGAHVLCEKPLATSLADGRAAIAACERAGVQLHLAFVSRFDPMIRQMRDLIADGSVGEVRGIVSQCPGELPDGQESWGPAESVGWLTDPVAAGGGAVMDHSVHAVDAIRFVTGAEVTRVSAELGALLKEELPVEDTASLLLELDNGAVAAVDPSWSGPKRWDWYLRVVGSEGVLTNDDTRSALQVAGRNGRYRRPRFGADLDAGAVQHFVDCVIRGQPADPAASGADGLRALEVVLAAYQSERTGQPTALDLLAA